MSEFACVNMTSPSLADPRAGLAPAFEMKFVVDEPRAEQVEAWAQGRMAMDAHGETELGGAYRTISLYCDTPQLDVFLRSPSYKRRKYRLRRYGDASWLFLERKTRSGDRVAKRRTAVALEDLSPLAQPLSLTTWPGHWFHRRLLARRLRPACQVGYLRKAYVGTGVDGPLRLTLDRQLHGALSEQWSIEPIVGGLPLLAGQIVLELKFRAVLPSAFKELMGDLRLTPCPVSKYRLCRQAWGATLATDGQARRDACTSGRGENFVQIDAHETREVAYA